MRGLFRPKTTDVAESRSQSTADIESSSQSTADVESSNQSTAVAESSSQSTADVEAISQSTAVAESSSRSIADVEPSSQSTAVAESSSRSTREQQVTQQRLVTGNKLSIIDRLTIDDLLHRQSLIIADSTGFAASGLGAIAATHRDIWAPNGTAEIVDKADAESRSGKKQLRRRATYYEPEYNYLNCEGDTEFANANGYSWDLVIVMPHPKTDNSQSDTEWLEKERLSQERKAQSNYDYIAAKDLTAEVRTKRLRNMLAEVGLETYAFYSVQRDEVYIKVRAALGVLMAHADANQNDLKLDPNKLQRVATQGKLKSGVSIAKSFREAYSRDAYANRVAREDLLHPFEDIYADYDASDDLIDLFENADDFHGNERLSHPFGSILRIRLIHHIIVGPRSRGGLSLDVSKMKEKRLMLAYFPLHDLKVKRQLQSQWCRCFPIVPNPESRDNFRKYFGAQMTLFYVYLGHHTAWTGYLALLGLGVSIQCLVELRLSTVANECFALIVPVWAVCLNEFWKREEKSTALRWGMVAFESEETIRPAFLDHDGTKKRPDPVDGQESHYYPDGARKGMQAVSIVVTVVMLAAVVAVIGVVSYLKNVFSGDSLYVLSFANAIIIQILNFLWTSIACWLNGNENHQTQTQYNDSLILKLFCFQFVNSYGSLYYIAFIQVYIFNDPCEYGSCINDLAYSVAITFGTNLLVQNCQSLVVPLLLKEWRYYRETTGTDRTGLSAPELQYLMMPFDPCLDSINSYMTLVRQFGYMVLFIVACPAAPVFVFISNYLQIRMDSHNLLNTYQRILPQGAQDVGAWQGVVTMLCVAAVVTNTALICFVMNTFDALNLHNLTYFKALMFLAGQYVLASAMAVAVLVVPDVSFDVEIQIKRMEFINAKVMHQMADDEANEVEPVKAILKIHKKDSDGKKFTSTRNMFDGRFEFRPAETTFVVLDPPPEADITETAHLLSSSQPHFLQSHTNES